MLQQPANQESRSRSVSPPSPPPLPLPFPPTHTPALHQSIPLPLPPRPKPFTAPPMPRESGQHPKDSERQNEISVVCVITSHVCVFYVMGLDGKEQPFRNYTVWTDRTR